MQDSGSLRAAADLRLDLSLGQGARDGIVLDVPPRHIRLPLRNVEPFHHVGLTLVQIDRSFVEHVKRARFFDRAKRFASAHGIIHDEALSARGSYVHVCSRMPRTGPVPAPLAGHDLP